MEKTHLLNVLHGLFLLLISIGPIILLIWGIRLIKSFVNQVLNGINIGLKKIAELFNQIKEKLDAAKSKVETAGKALLPVENDIKTIESTTKEITDFTNQISNLDTELTNILSDLDLKIPELSLSGLISLNYKRVSIEVTHIDIPDGIHTGSLSFPKITLGNLKGINVPGLGEVNTAFKDLTTIFQDITNTFNTLLSPFNAIENVSQDIKSAVEDVAGTGQEIKAISSQIETLLESITKIGKLFGKKFKIYAIVIGILSLGIYLNWCIPNITNAWTLITGDTSVITLSGFKNG